MARERAAGRLGSRVGIGGALVLALYLIWRTPNELTPRIFAAASVLLTYVVLHRFVSRLMFDYVGVKKAEVDPAATDDAGSGE